MDGNAVGAGVGLFSILIWIVIYVYFSYSFMVIANKTGTDGAWMAWVPIVQIYLLCKVGGKPGWWLILFFIPLVNIVFSIIVFMAVAEARGKPSWIGILMIVPFVNFIIPGYLAFTE